MIFKEGIKVTTQGNGPTSTPPPATQPTPPTAPAAVKRTWMPTTAGILTIIAGALQIIGGLALTLILPYFIVASGSDVFKSAIIGIGALGIPIIVLGIIAIVGGIYAIKRRLWGLALVGAIIALAPSSILGILAIIFVAISKKEFT